ncbi:hypothetical protein GUJ93_ZPchr0002g26005 [Zizania palustris]|uniref:Uncharacterized protein n=1 Tax=Zizania palustris TaxID=103762 RepID=A0A8J5SNA3_ZIZPA|nr:hypothetical protein GUJ93_ZPchr0002g26005 [Zizania palustris]
MSVMQQLNFISLLLLLSLMLLVAAAYRELPMARNGEEEDHHGQAKLDQAAHVVVGVASTWRPGSAEKNCRFRPRNLPADAKSHFDGHTTPFTADYVSVHQHPPKHN